MDRALERAQFGHLENLNERSGFGVLVPDYCHLLWKTPIKSQHLSVFDFFNQ